MQTANRDSSGNRQWWIQRLDALRFFYLRLVAYAAHSILCGVILLVLLLVLLGGSVRLVTGCAVAPALC